MATIQVTNSFNKTIQKQPQLKKPFEKALEKVLSDPRHYLTKKIQHSAKNRTDVFNTEVPGTGQGDCYRVLFTNQNGLLVPFFISTHDDYMKTLHRIDSGAFDPAQEKTVSFKLKTIEKFGAITPENALTARALQAT